MSIFGKPPRPTPGPTQEELRKEEEKKAESLSKARAYSSQEQRRVQDQYVRRTGLKI